MPAFSRFFSDPPLTKKIQSEFRSWFAFYSWQVLSFCSNRLSDTWKVLVDLQQFVMFQFRCIFRSNLSSARVPASLFSPLFRVSLSCMHQLHFWIQSDFCRGPLNVFRMIWYSSAVLCYPSADVSQKSSGYTVLNHIYWVQYD